MTRKNKIIVSVVGIFIILLALLGITYGYFLTRIEGNTNTNSVFVTTTNLRLVYEDDTNEIMTRQNIYPITFVDGIDDIANDNIDEPIGTKSFTVTNEGDSDISEYVIYLENVINNFEATEDVRILMTCTSELENGTAGTCNGFNNYYPTKNIKLLSNSIKKGETHTYDLKVYYYDTGLDQSDDMGKTLQGKIQIYDPNDVIALSGVVTTAEGDEKNYFVEVQSIPKISQIASDGSYIIHGIEPGTHTLFVKYLDTNGIEKTISSKQIVVSKNTTANISTDGTSIVMSSQYQNAVLNVGVSSNNITLTGENIESPVTYYTQTDIDNSNGKLIAVGETDPLYVVAVVNEDGTTLTLKKNGNNSDGILNNYDMMDSPLFDFTLNEIIIEKGIIMQGTIPLVNTIYKGTIHEWLKDNANFSQPLTCENGGYVTILGNAGTGVVYLTKPYITNYSQTDINNSEGKLIAMGATDAEGVPDLGVVAEFNDDYTTATLTANQTENTAYTGKIEEVADPYMSDYIGLTSYTNLKNIVIKNGITNLGQYMCFYQSSVESISIPKTVTTLNEFAIQNCENLTTIHYEGTVREWEELVSLNSNWEISTGEYTVYCSDGVAKKSI